MLFCTIDVPLIFWVQKRHKMNATYTIAMIKGTSTVLAIAEDSQAAWVYANAKVMEAAGLEVFIQSGVGEEICKALESAGEIRALLDAQNAICACQH